MIIYRYVVCCVKIHSYSSEVVSIALQFFRVGIDCVIIAINVIRFGNSVGLAFNSVYEEKAQAQKNVAI